MKYKLTWLAIWLIVYHTIVLFLLYDNQTPFSGKVYLWLVVEFGAIVGVGRVWIRD